MKSSEKQARESSFTANKTVTAIGEVLWDITPAGSFPGGAPFNTAVHMSRLGVPTRFISRVGADREGRDLREIIARQKLPVEHIQTDPTYPTGKVTVSFPEPDRPCYTIAQPAAWDFIEPPRPEYQTDLLLHGTLALRGEKTRQTIWHLRRNAGQIVLDLNLRPPFTQWEIIRQAISGADWLKVNEEELAALKGWLNLEGSPRSVAEKLLKHFKLRGICITRAAKGAAFLNGNDWFEYPGYAVKLGDPVGAGDAFLAGFIFGLLQGWSGAGILETANALGALVAAEKGAIPSLPPAVWDKLKNGNPASLFLDRISDGPK